MTLTFAQRFYCRVVKTDSCHLWDGFVDDSGYGKFQGKRVHRTAWELANGPIPEGLLIRHLCHNRICVNPSHLTPGTQVDNMGDLRDKRKKEEEQRMQSLRSFSQLLQDIA